MLFYQDALSRQLITLARKYPQADRECGWQWIVPVSTISADTRTGERRRHRRHESVPQRAIREARRRVGIATPVGPHTLRHRFATLSDGSFYAPLNSFKRHETRVRKAQQALSRKVQFSNARKKAKARLQRIHSRLADARRDFLHNLPVLRSCLGGQPLDASRVRMSGMRVRGQRRCGRRDQCAKGGTRPVSL
jgi:hypothetical protein